MNARKIYPRLAGAAFSLALAIGGSTSAMSTAAADSAPPATPFGIFDGVCDGQGAFHSASPYVAGDGTVKLLRCGDAGSWGYRYLDSYFPDGFTSALHQQISTTLANGSPNDQGGNITWWINSGHVVVVDNNLHTDGSPRGIVDTLFLSPREIESLGVG